MTEKFHFRAGWLLGCCLFAVANWTFASTVTAQDDMVIADFEGQDYGQWSLSGNAFGSGPARGSLPGQMQVDGFQGAGLVNSFAGGDGSTGVLTSPKFRIERSFIAFLIGGGMDEQRTCIRLLVDGKIVRSATGSNDRPGGSETLQPASWDMTQMMGKEAVLEIVDSATGGWGHINVDHIVQTNKRPPGMLTNVKHSVQLVGKYLNLPIKNGAPKRVVQFFVDGELIVRNDIELAEDSVDWWAPMDVGVWKGKTMELHVDKFPENAVGLSLVTSSDRAQGQEDLYREKLRGQIHFSPRRGWNNDPNGLVYFNGEYHLFFQHNPYGWGWGNMHWGHAVSRDLVHWEELGDKLLPDAMGPMFSGSAVVDWNNSSGLGENGKPPMVLFYTAAGNPTVQCLAYSVDGRRFTKLADNPILPQITGGNRDPKVLWHEPSKNWIMVLYVTLEGGKHTVHIFKSKNLKQWELASVVPGEANTNFLFECPDFFELPMDGNEKQKRWVMLGANSEYGLGEFDGQQFSMSQRRLPGHRGRGFYAAQTFSDIPANDGRRIMIGWFQTETAGMPFNQSMTVPLELGLKSTESGPRLTFWPVRELSSLREKSWLFTRPELEKLESEGIDQNVGDVFELRCRLRGMSKGTTRLEVRGISIECDLDQQEIRVQGIKSPIFVGEVEEELVLFVDRQGIEIFASSGLTYIPLPVIASPTELSVRVDASSVARLQSLEIYRLGSIWAQR